MSIETKGLREALDLLRHAARPKKALSSAAIMEHIRLQAGDGATLVMSAYDLESEVVCRVDAHVSALDVCVQAQRFAAIVASAGQEIDLSVVKTGLSLKSGSGRFRLPTLPGNMMPTINVEGEPIASGDYTLLREEIANCHFAAAKMDVLRPALNGVGVSCSGKKFAVTGCSGYAFARSVFELDCADFSATLPNLPALLEEFYTFKVYASFITLHAPNHTVTVKLLAHQYPSISRVVEQPRVGGFSIERDQLVEALEAVKPFTTRACLFKTEADRLVIRTASPLGEAERTVPLLTAATQFECSLNLDQIVAIARRCEEKPEFYWGEGFPTAPGTPLLVKSGRGILGSTVERV